MKRLILLLAALLLLSGCGFQRFLVPSELRDTAPDVYLDGRQAITDFDDGAEADGTPMTPEELRDAYARTMQWVYEVLLFTSGQDELDQKPPVELHPGVTP